MSDHLIAEANRHAKALAVERNNLSVELNLLREWQREVIQNARAHHAEREDAIARAERAEAEVAELKESILVQRIFSDYRQRAESAEAELATERARLDWVFRNCKITINDYHDVYAIHDREDLGAAMKEDPK